MERLTNPLKQDIELGKVTWFRDYNQAIQESKKTNKAILLFFQEIPGCSTCVNYGREVLSHPLMVELIENEFVPLAIQNNKAGKDAQILKQFNEPSWNNPVTRFIDSDGKDIISKLANQYNPLDLYYKIIDALKTLKRSIPLYATILANDLKIKYRKAASTIYETPCFWSGETSLAQHPAVFSTEAGWIDHKEVVKIYFDADKTTLEDLDSFAKEQGFFLTDKHTSYRIDKNPQYYLKKSRYRYLPLSLSQRTKINYALPYNAKPETFLSPKQKQFLDNTSFHKNEINYTLDIEQSWLWTS